MGILILLMLFSLLMASLIGVLYIENKKGSKAATSRQLAELQARVEALEQHASTTGSELGRLQDGQKFTERLLTERSSASRGPDE